MQFDRSATWLRVATFFLRLASLSVLALTEMPSTPHCQAIHATHLQGTICNCQGTRLRNSRCVPGEQNLDDSFSHSKVRVEYEHRHKQTGSGPRNMKPPPWAQRRRLSTRLFASSKKMLYDVRGVIKEGKGALQVGGACGTCHSPGTPPTVSCHESFSA